MTTISGNRILRSLNVQDRERVAKSARHVSLAKGEIFARSDEAARAVLFPDGAVVSLMLTYSDGSTIEMATIGREGSTGIVASLGGNIEIANHIVQIPGRAVAVPFSEFKSLIENLPQLKSLVCQHAQLFLFQVLVSGGCNGVHRTEQRLARWLLTMHDRVDGDEVPLTHDFLADMLGVHRPSVSVAAGLLQSDGLISYRRGLIRIIDRDGLENASCECFRLIETAKRSLLPGGDAPAAGAWSPYGDRNSETG